jgi:uncharacterized membrane protein YfhO
LLLLVRRANVSLMAVPVPAGAREVALDYAGRAFARGRTITWVSLLIVALGALVPVVLRRRSTPAANPND